MELSWITKTKISMVLAIGGILLGVLAWPLVAPYDPTAPVCLSEIQASGWILLPLLAFLAGFLGYFAGWPYGREVGILAVPAGLGVLSLRGGVMQILMQGCPTLASRQAIYGSLRWEPIAWLTLVGLGYGGMRVAARLRAANPTTIPEIHHETRHDAYTHGLVAVVLSAVTALILIGVFSQNTPLAQATVATQPRAGQIAFALCLAFGGAAFAARLLLKVGIIWTLAAMTLLYNLGTWFYARGSVMSRLVERLPATCYPHALMAITPLQLVAFGTIGTVMGYWMAVRYSYWRRHECI